MNGTLTIAKFLGPRARRPKKLPTDKAVNDEKRPRTAFSGPQLVRLKVIIYMLWYIRLMKSIFVTNVELELNNYFINDISYEDSTILDCKYC